MLIYASHGGVFTIRDHSCSFGGKANVGGLSVTFGKGSMGRSCPSQTQRIFLGIECRVPSVSER